MDPRLTICCIILSLSTIINGDFIEEPGPGPVVEFIGMQARLNCSVTEGNRVAWELDLPDQSVAVSTDQAGVLEALANQGITVEEPAERSSVLVVNGTVENNDTLVTCIAASETDPTLRPRSRNVSVIFEAVLSTTTDTTDTIITTTSESLRSGANAALIIGIIIAVVITVIAVTVIIILVVVVVLLKNRRSKPSIRRYPVLPEYHEKEFVKEKTLRKASEESSEIVLAKNSSGDFVILKKFKDLESLQRDSEDYSWIAQHLKNENIVRPFGVCTPEKFIVLEYMENGDLNDFMKQNKNTISIRTMIKMCRQIAGAMAFLHKKNIVHCNLTSKNSLVGKDFLVKITDFRLCLELKQKQYSFDENRSDLPIRWMAPECFNDKQFSRTSDRWAFGVTMWEVFTYCKNIPYSNKKKDKDVIELIKSNKTLETKNISKDIRDIIESCWRNNPPTFKQLEEKLRELE